MDHINKTDEFRLLVKIKNNRLISMREAQGLSAPQIAKKIGISYSIYSQYESLSIQPLRSKNGNIVDVYRSTAIKISEYFKVHPDYLFSESIKAIKKSMIKKSITAERLYVMSLAIDPQTPEELVSRKEDNAYLQNLMRLYLKPREEKIIKQRFGFTDQGPLTCKEIGIEQGCTLERIRQIEKEALRKLHCRM